MMKTLVSFAFSVCVGGEGGGERGKRDGKCDF